MKRHWPLWEVPAMVFTCTLFLSLLGRPDEEPSQSKGKNLVQNGSFEEGEDSPLHWDRVDGLCTFWVADEKRGGKCIKMDTDVLLSEFRQRREEMKGKNPPPAKPKTPPAGKGYDTVAAHDGVSLCSDIVSVEEGAAYRLSVDFREGPGKRRSKVPKVFVIGYLSLKGEMRRGYKVYKNCAGSGDWQAFTLEFNPTKSSPQIQWVRVKLFAYWPPGVYFFDNVRIEKKE